VASSTRIDELYGLSRRPPGSLAELAEALSRPAQLDSAEFGRFAGQLSELARTTAEQGDALSANTNALFQNTAAQSQGGAAGAVATVARGFGSRLLSGNPLLGGIAGIFGGRTSDTPVESFARYLRPERRDLEIGISPSTEAYYVASRSHTVAAGQAHENSGSRPVPQVVVQVNALDTRSFLDHSADIAKALREAVLNSTTVSDVLNEW
jgi:hypothetical protein